MFEIKNLNCNNCDEYVFLTDTEDLDYDIYNIYDTLKQKKGETFSIIVDCLLRTGNSYNRFIELFYNKGKFHRSIIINPRDVDNNIKQSTMYELSINTKLLDESSMSKKEIEVVKGMIKNNEDLMI